MGGNHRELVFNVGIVQLIRNLLVFNVGIVQLIRSLPVTQGAAGWSPALPPFFIEVGAASLPELSRVDQCGAEDLGNASRSGAGRSPAAAGRPD